MDIVPERYQDDDESIPSWLDQEEAFLDNALNCQPDLPGRVSNPLGYLTSDRPWQASPYILSESYPYERIITDNSLHMEPRSSSNPQ